MWKMLGAIALLLCEKGIIYMTQSIPCTWFNPSLTPHNQEAEVFTFPFDDVVVEYPRTSLIHTERAKYPRA